MSFYSLSSLTGIEVTWKDPAKHTLSFDDFLTKAESGKAMPGSQWVELTLESTTFKQGLILAVFSRWLARPNRLCGPSALKCVIRLLV